MSKVEEKPIPLVEINEFLRSPGSAGKSDKEIALLLGTVPKEVTRIRKQIQKEHAQAQEVSAGLPPSGSPPEDYRAPAIANSEGSSPSDSVLPADPESPAVESGRQMVRVDQFDITSGTMVRPLADRYVNEYVRDLEAAKERATNQDRPPESALGIFPDFEAYWVTDLDPPRLCLVSGFHRRQAALEVFGPGALLATDVKVGTFEEAKLAAYRHNRKHGYRLTTEDRARIVEEILQNPKWARASNTRIAELAGEEGPSGRLFVGQVRKQYHERSGTPAPETIEVERGGKVYDVRPANQHPRGKADAAETDQVQGDPDPSGGDLTPAERAEEANRQYLETIPCRQHLHGELLADFDRKALAYRKLSGLFATALNWVKNHREDFVPDEPAFADIERITKIGRPWGGLAESKDTPPEDRVPPWVACGTCAVAAGEEGFKLSTGLVDNKPCSKCNGAGWYPKRGR